MNTKGMKFLAVLAVLAMAFAAVAVIAPAETDDATDAAIATDNLTPLVDGATLNSTTTTYYANTDVKVKLNATGVNAETWNAIKEGTYTNAVKIVILKGCSVTFENIGETEPAVSAWIGLSETAGTTSGKKVAVTDASQSDKNLWFGVGDKSNFQTVQVGENWAIYFGPTSAFMDVTSDATVTGNWTSGYIRMCENGNAIALNLTATIWSSDMASTQFKVTKFTGVLSYFDTTGVSIAIWASGDVEVVKGIAEKTLINADVPAGATLYVDGGAIIATGGGDINHGSSTTRTATTFYNDGTISVKQDKTVEVPVYGTFTLANAMTNNGNINNLGTFNHSGKVVTNEGKITTGYEAANVTWTSTDGKVKNNGTFTFKETTVAATNVIFDKESTGDIVNKNTNTVYMNGVVENNNTFGVNQTVEVNANTTLKGVNTLNGVLIVDEGVTLTIVSGGKIVTGENATQAVIINNGNIIVQSADGINLAAGGFFQNNGTITLTDPAGADATTFTVGGTGVAFFKNAGTLTNSQGTMNVAATGSFMNLKGATFNQNSTLSLGEGAVVSNSGAMKIDGKITLAADQDLTIDDKSATITISGLTIGENSLVIKNKVDSSTRTITLATTGTNVLSGLTIGTYNIPDVTPTKTTNNYGYFVIGGNVSYYTSSYGEPEAAYTITLSDKAVIGDLTIQKKVELKGDNTADSEFKFIGTAYIVDSASATIANLASATVTGKVIVNKVQLNLTKDNSVINAAMYMVDVNFDKVYYYTTLENAVAEAYLLDLDEVIVTGTIDVESDMIIPEGLKVVNKNNLNIEDGATVTVVDGAELNNLGKITVGGALYAEDAADITGNTTDTAIVSDVKVVGIPDVLFTNLYDALDSAEAGDIVVITKNDGNPVVLTKNTTIKEGVILDTNEKNLATRTSDTDKYTLTIDGVLMLYGGSTFTNFADVKLNGFISNDSEMTYTTTGVSGAYFYDSDDDLYYIAGVKNLGYITASGITTVNVWGDVSTATLEFAGASSTATVNFHNAVDVTTITANKAKIVFYEGNAVVATVTDGVNAVKLSGETPAGSNLTIAIGDDFTVSGGFGYGETVKAAKYAFTTSGTTVIGDLNVYNLKVDGIAATKKTVTVTNKLTVTGDLDVLKGGNLTAAYAMVTGSIDVADDGAADLIKLTIGSSSSAIAAVASVTGNVTSTAIVLYAGNSVDPEIVEEMKSSSFYIDGKLWFTVYSNGAVELDDDGIVVPVSDARAETQLLDDDGDLFILEGVLFGTVTPDNTTDYDIDVRYSIYRVEIKSDAGIKEISINGKIMKSPAAGQNVFWLNDLEAGTYTVRYTLIDGYEGTAQLTTIDGTILKDNKFALAGTEGGQWEEIEGTDGYYVFEYQLAGTEPAVTPEPITPEEQSEWTITTILLVILVILIAIMAVIVAIRLNRS